MRMRLLVDEDTSPSCADGLLALGFEADHVVRLGLSSLSDLALFDFALRNGYSGMVTHDGFTEQGTEPGAQRAMIHGLRIIKLAQPRREPRGPIADIERLERHLFIIREALVPGSIIRRVKIWGANRRPELETILDARDQLLAIELRRIGVTWPRSGTLLLHQ